MDSKENSSINFCGTTHDHDCDYAKERLAYVNKNSEVERSGGGSNTTSTKIANEQNNIETSNIKSVITILRRHTMYDCLILVKKYRSCLQGYSLEFPLDIVSNQRSNHMEGDYDNSLESISRTNDAASCGRRQLVSRVLDGDDPIHQACAKHLTRCTSFGQMSGAQSSSVSPNVESTNDDPKASGFCFDLVNPFSMEQIGDNGKLCELVLVPVNGLLDRLDNYTRSGVAVDSRVYAFAMGLKTSERILTSTSMRELQETPV